MNEKKLIFSRTDSQSGLTNASISASNDKDASVIIRELLQNSFDSAIDDAKCQQAQIKFIIDTIQKSNIPGIVEYENAINAIEKEKLSEQEKDILSAIKEELAQDTIPIMYVVDNGIGFNQETLVSILSDGISVKSDPMNSGGSYGNGHFSAFNISNLRYVLYGGKSSDGKMICSGQALLRTSLFISSIHLMIVYNAYRADLIGHAQYQLTWMYVSVIDFPVTSLFFLLQKLHIDINTSGFIIFGIFGTIIWYILTYCIMNKILVTFKA